MEQPRGPSFVIEDNHLVKWANWEFHLKPDPRAGLIISRVRFHDPDTQETRDVMYKGFVSELFVPYTIGGLVLQDLYGRRRVWFRVTSDAA